MMNLRALMASANNNGNLSNWSLYDTSHDTSSAEFSTSVTRYCCAVNIDDSRALLVYRGTSSNCRARIVSVDTGGNVTLGAETVIAATTITEASVTLLSSTQAVIGYKASHGGGQPCHIVAINYSGTSITNVGTFVNPVSSIVAFGISLTALSATEALVAFGDNTNNKGQVHYFSVASDRTIILGNSVDYESGAAGGQPVNNVLTALTSSKAVLFYESKATGTSSHGLAKLITVSGTTPSVTDTLNITTPATCAAVNAVKMASDKLLLVWSDLGNTDVRGVVVSEASSVLSKGTTQNISTASAAQYLDVSLPDSTHAVVSYGEGNSAINLLSGVIEISGTSLNPLTVYQNSSANVDWVANVNVGQEFVVLFYMDDDDSDKGKYIRLKPNA